MKIKLTELKKMIRECVRSTLKETRAKCHDCGADGEIEGMKYTQEPRDEYDFKSPLPRDFETCGDCGFDHAYEPEESARWHEENDPDFGKY